MQSRYLRLTLILVWVTLALAFNVRPAEGLAFYEQREAIAPPCPQLEPAPHQVVVNLSGAWEWRSGEKGDFRPGWIPGCFEGDENVVSLRRTFVLGDSLKPFHFQLFLPEIHYTAEVWLNGILISSFTGSHLGFECDLPRDRLRFGTPNDILLRIDNSLTPRTTLPVRSQLLHPRNYGGVFAGAFLRGVPAWSVEDVGLVSESLTDSSAVRSSVRVRIAQYRSLGAGADSLGSTSGVRVHAMVRDTTGRLVAEGWSDRIERGTSENFQTTISLPKFAASFWSPARPTLYKLTAQIVAGSDTLHQLTRKIGFKHVEVVGAQLYLNGQRLRIRGIDYIPENSHSRRCISPSILRQDLTKIRDLGMNVIRVPFGPPPPELINVADEMGIMVLAECGLDWIPGEVLARSEYRNLVQHSVERLIVDYRDHVSVLAWGLGSQLEWRDPATRDFSQWLYRIVKEQDSRPTYLEGSDPGRLVGLADFALASQRPDGVRSYYNQFPRSSVPVVISRIGRLAALSGTGRDNSSTGIVNQAEFLIRQVNAVEADDAVSGYLIHSYSDYHGTSPLLAQPNRHDPFLYSFGIVGFDRDERIAYSKLKDLAQTGQSTPPVPADANDQPPITFPVVGLAAVLLLSVEIRRNNVFRQNLKRAFLHAHGFYSDLRYRRFLHTAQPFLLWLLESVTLALLVASAFYVLRDSFVVDYNLTHFLPGPGVKSWLVNLIWDPTRAVIYFTGVFMVLIMAKTAVVRVGSMLFREKVDFWQSANYVIWSFAALLFLLPVAAIFYRAAEMTAFSGLVYLVIAAGLVWCGLRLMTALRTGFGTTTWRVYLTVFGIGAIAVAIVVVVLDSRLGTLTYLPFFHSVFAAQ